MSKIWQIVKPVKFFPKYAPGVKNYYRKIKGINTRGNNASFTDDDKKMIAEGLRNFFHEVTKIQ